MSSLALTDHHALYGAVAFCRACEQAGVQPLLGMTVDMAPPPGALSMARRRGRLVLLARDGDGYRSLCRLSAWLQGTPDRSQRQQQGLPWDLLRAQRAGLLCLDGGQQGWLYTLLRGRQEREAARYLSHLGAIFQEDGFLGLEVQRVGDEDLAQQAAALGERFGLRPVALQPVYCLESSEREQLTLLAAVAAQTTVAALPPENRPGGGDRQVALHWLAREEVAARFDAVPQALSGIGDVVQQCGPALPGGSPIWPALALPAGETADDALAREARAGLRRRYGARAAPAVSARLEEELEAIAGHGFAPLLLAVATIVRHARAEQIPVSTRGSVANSLVAYCLEITTVDPVDHDLLFARFLNPARRSLPDIDLDFCSRQRDRVLDFARRHFGRDRVALVGAMTTMRPRSALREAAKAWGQTEAWHAQLAARLPQAWHESDTPLPSDLDGTEEAVVLAARTLVGLPHHAGLHPGGLIITPGPVADFVPVQWARKGYLATQYDHEDVEAIGLPKLDLLGIRALTVLADAAALVRDHHDPHFRLEDVTDGDDTTGALLAQGGTVGVFQCESEGARRTLRQLQAHTVRDLAVANAFFKPGPATGGMAAAFIRRYRGEEEVTLLHPSLAPILGSTHGVLLFQEQVLRVAREIAGLSWAQADRLRRGMSKMRAQAMLALHADFVHGCQRPAPAGPGMGATEAEQLWEQVVAFAGYGFNQGHATAYADVSYRSAYLKAHYPAPFLCARLANGGGFFHPAVYFAEARRLGIVVRPPHVNHAGRRITLAYEGDQPVLWLGLDQVYGLRREAIAAIVAAREQRPFAGLRDVLVRVELRAGEATNLIRCGALAGWGESRAALLAEAEPYLRAGSARQLAFSFAQAATTAAETAGERVAWERSILGLPVSVHPIQLLGEKQKPHMSLRHLADSAGKLVTIAGVRLPGRTGSQGFYLDDGDDYVLVRSNGQGRPPAWQPLRLRGRWRQGRWGGGWFQAETVRING
jgi:DNA-directed DNA polymerase III PolC